MTDLLVRDIDPDLKRRLEQRARAHGRSLAEKVRALLERSVAEESGITAASSAVALGTRLFAMLPDKWRGDDLEFGLPRDMPEPAALKNLPTSSFAHRY